MKWIKTELELPQENKLILLCWPEARWQDNTAQKKEYKEGFFVGIFRYPSFETEDQTLVWPINEISYWMEIPELPKD